MKKSRRLFLADVDYDEELIAAQMSQKFVEGIGFYGWKEGAIVDPADISGTRPGEGSRSVREEHRSVLTGS